MALGARLVPLLVLSALACTACVSTETTTEVHMPKEDVLTRAEIDRRIYEIPYMHGLELVHNLERIARIGEPALPRLLEELHSEKAVMRSSVAWVLGAMGDRRNIPPLRELLADRVPEVRYEAAASLVDLGDAAGFAVLVDGLSDPQLDNRFKCFESLRTATGQDFGYDHDGAPELRRAAVARWHDWLDGVRASAL